MTKHTYTRYVQVHIVKVENNNKNNNMLMQIKLPRSGVNIENIVNGLPEFRMKLSSLTLKWILMCNIHRYNAILLSHNTAHKALN